MKVKKQKPIPAIEKRPTNKKRHPPSGAWPLRLRDFGFAGASIVFLAASRRRCVRASRSLEARGPGGGGRGVDGTACGDGQDLYRQRRN